MVASDEHVDSGGQPVPEHAVMQRIQFGVLNLPITKSMNCGSFLLTPLPDVAQRLKAIRQFEAPSEITSAGTYALPEGIAPDDAWRLFEREPIREMDLLLSFANRRHIQFVYPTLQEDSEENWKSIGQLSSPYVDGRAFGAPWYGHQLEMEDFLTRSLTKVTNASWADQTGILLALSLLCQNYRRDLMEMLYLKTWIAIEILYGRNVKKNEIVAEKIMSKTRKRLRSVLSELVAENLINQDEMNEIDRKIPELNRMTTATQAQKFFADVFKSYPAQDVTPHDLHEFIKIRNEITHRGVMSLSQETKYDEELHRQHRRLLSLLERCILAILDEKPNLMMFRWSNWRHAR